MIRIGHGYDVHAFCKGDYVVLCGEQIQHTQALKAHSDGDVVLHALSDALLGAMALGDIGHFFPDTDPKYKGADSRYLLREVVSMLKSKNVAINNVDMTIVAQAPKMAPHIQKMRENVAQDLDISVEQVSVKATTTEKLGFTGREEGIAAYASVLVSQG